MKAYLANDLFNEATQMYNSYLAENIRKAVPGIELYVPQENEALNDKNGYADSVTIFDGDNVYLDPADMLIAVIDLVDEGVAAEIGRYALYNDIRVSEGKEPRPIYVLFTDVRQNGTANSKKIDALKADSIENQFIYKNLYEVGGVKKYGKVFKSSQELFKYLEENYGQ